MFEAKRNQGYIINDNIHRMEKNYNPFSLQFHLQEYVIREFYERYPYIYIKCCIFCCTLWGADEKNTNM